MQVVDVGGGTGFATQGIVRSVPPANVTLLDQSPHQLAKARRKADLQGVTILEVCEKHHGTPLFWHAAHAAAPCPPRRHGA
jgi:trans-aconitate methyltransferase